MRTLTLFVGLLGALGGLAANAVTVVSGAYARLGSEALQANSSSSVGTQASRIALRLAPWRADAHLGLAWTAAARGDLEAVRAHEREALRWSPASPYLWSARVHLLARRLEFTAEMEHATARAEALGPRALNVQMRNALIGVSFWSWGTPELQASWARSMKLEMSADRKRFVTAVVRSGQLSSFCGVAPPEVGARDWCNWAFGAMERCIARAHRPRYAAWCRKSGFLP